MLKFIADVLKPILTILVTITALAFLASVFAPAVNVWIQEHLPVWAQLDGAVETVRQWLGIAREETPWWQFWR